MVEIDTLFFIGSVILHRFMSATGKRQLIDARYTKIFSCGELPFYFILVVALVFVSYVHLTRSFSLFQGLGREGRLSSICRVTN